MRGSKTRLRPVDIVEGLKRLFGDCGIAIQMDGTHAFTMRHRRTRIIPTLRIFRLPD
jgi:hypothetical protein